MDHVLRYAIMLAPVMSLRPMRLILLWEQIGHLPKF